VTEIPHTGCAKFVDRFGKDAMRFVNSPLGRELRLRGLNAKVVVAGTVRPGDQVRRLPAGSSAPTDELTSAARSDGVEPQPS
jgi:MOSC domain-containing protein YiiM